MPKITKGVFPFIRKYYIWLAIGIMLTAVANTIISRWTERALDNDGIDWT